ncbi:class I SAM-dependent methyltransferase [Actinosynnema mirum]|uniref:Methyltransferase type 12 n=1 Tax=Actinosynnema mirum (strain ATCC 29888 / DSM 43827 / JCM 3225 / NBRC 14064 / NCIMB 13271 / NRRL B-12336 / IMRU 3971 / 101) TaxID=446462 RepID=C6WRS1_ACTMD|nr:class I SAM-dependent methyltransferase [Actinosynnema mirum]ACU36913.1 Methyltransferase type 12 [Actinosynnema mirum DSM 43827]
MTHAAHQHTSAGHGHGHPHGHDHAHGHDAANTQIEILDLDAEVLADQIASIVDSLPVPTPPATIVDLGAGTGAGALALLRRFPDAQVTAVDTAPAHLRRLVEKAETAGVADRVHPVEADLNAQWPPLGVPELVWASASLHHVDDPARVLRLVHDLLAPGGLFALVELADFPRFLPAGAPAESPGLEDRCHAAAPRHEGHADHRGTDWTPHLIEAGFTIEAHRTVTINLAPPLPDSVGRYALNALRGLRHQAADALAPEDLAVLDRLIDPDDPRSALRRPDLTVRTERVVWAARKP